MKATFTPGPWRVERGLHDAAIRSAHFHIALVTSGLDDDPSQPTFAANARLIAAAPELYAWMRKELADYDDMGHDGSDCDCVSCVRVAEARAILTRIDGEDAS